MKYLIVAVFCLSASAALAIPAVGDSSTFDLTIQQGNQSVNASVNMQLSSYDAASQTYNEMTTYAYNGQTQSQPQTVAAADLVTSDQIQQALTNCAVLGGTNELVTVPAGPFPTCKITQAASSGTATIWVGMVPFGLVKEVKVANGSTITLTLRTFSIGK